MPFKNKILIVEDELSVAMRLKHCLEKEKLAKGIIAKNYNEAVALLKSESFEMVFLDINLSSSKTGIDLARHINDCHNIPFLYITSSTDSETLASLLATFPEAYISKPFSNAAIIATVNILRNKLKSSKIFTVKVGKMIYSINLENLLYAKTEHIYLELFFINKRLIIRHPMSKFLKQLPKNSLIQISRGIAVNPSFITKNTTKTVMIENIVFNKSSNYSDL